MDIGYVGGRIAVGKYALVTLVEDIHRLENIASLLHLPRQVRVQRIVAAAMAEVTKYDHAMPAVLQNAAAGPEEPGQCDDEVVVAGYVREIMRVIAVAGGQPFSEALLPDLVIWPFVENTPVR